MKLGRKHLGLIVLAIGVVTGGYVAFDRWILNSGLPEGLIQANGRIEGDHVTIASKFPGRITELRAREGDTVARDQPLVILDDVQTRARVEQAQSAASTNRQTRRVISPPCPCAPNPATSS